MAKMKILLLFNFFLLILVLARVKIAESKRRSRRGFKLSKEDLELYTLDHHSIEDYDFTTPVYIEPKSMVSKRSVDSGPVVTSEERDVKFNAFGRMYHLRLQPNYWLLRQGLVVERVGADGTITEEEISGHDCHYYAYLISHVGESTGALSTCNGLRGLISYDDTDVYISPLKDHHALRYRRETQNEFDGEHAHIVYKRTSRRGQQTADTKSYASSSFDYDHDDDSNDDKESDVDVAYYTNDETSDYNGNDTYTNSTFCEEIYAPEYTEEEPNPSQRHSHSWDQGFPEGDNMSLPGPIFADMAAGQDEGEHLQEGGQRYIELLVLLDDAMNNFHKEDLMNYSMSLMNLVSRRYIDPSLRSEVHLVIVKIVVAESNQLTMTGLDGIDRTLSLHGEGTALTADFCAFQKHLNPSSDKHPLHFDGAVHITKRDLYTIYQGRKSYGLLGRAVVGTICRGALSCSINEDTGLETSLTIAHELGHNLNLHHDPTYGCTNRKNIMSTMLVIGATASLWSTCSADNFAKFLKISKSSCLRDAPSIGHPNVQMLQLPRFEGARYTRLEQCQKALGPSVSRLCGGAESYVTCGRIGCAKDGYCRYIGTVEGTSCGRNMWCLKGFCRSSIGGYPHPVDGGWGEWAGNYTQCSRTCGTGIAYRRRSCNNPVPRHGGNACEGPMYIMKTCNENPCRGINISDDFRHLECARTNPLYDKKHNIWEAYLHGDLYGDKLCELRCTSNKGYINVLRPPKKVSDGTKCWEDNERDELLRTRRCVNKRCKEFGCDGMYGSGKLPDKCGKCEGTGRTCRHVKGTFLDTLPVMDQTYYHWLTIPAGSTRVNISCTDGQYYAFALKMDGKFVFRPEGNKRIASKRFRVGKTLILLRSEKKKWEEIWILSGPTTKAIEIHVFKQKYGSINSVTLYNNPFLFYEWYQRIGHHVYYKWETFPISECSASCGGGNQNFSVTCSEEINGVGIQISARFCNETTKPSVIRDCNTHLCPGAHWLIGDWGSCSVTCDEGMIVRIVDCIEGSTMDVIPTIDCITDEGHRPKNYTIPCYRPPCPTHGPTSPHPTEIDVETTTYGNVTEIIGSSRDELPPFGSIPNNAACAKECNSNILLLSLIIGVLIAFNHLTCDAKY